MANHATQKRNVTKIKMIEVVLSCISERIVVLKSRRDNVHFEQMRFADGNKIVQDCLVNSGLTLLNSFSYLNTVHIYV